MANDYAELVKSIIEQIRRIIGPVAVTLAKQVKGITIEDGVKIEGDPQKAIKELMAKYKSLMGQVVITIAKKGAKPILERNPKLKVPEELR